MMRMSHYGEGWRVGTVGGVQTVEVYRTDGSTSFAGRASNGAQAMVDGADNDVERARVAEAFASLAAINVA